MTSFIPSEYNPFLLKIYELTILNHEKVTFSKLTEFFSRKQVCVTLDYLCNKCVIDENWDKTSGVWVRTFEIALQYRPFVEKLRSLK